MEYESPSAAYSGTLQSILMKREEKQRQAMLDQHKIEMDRAENARAERELELRHQEMQERQQDRRQSQQDRQALNASQIEQRQQAKYDKTVAGMKPGDVMTPDMARASVSLGEQSDLMNPKQGLRDFMETLPEGSPARTGVAAQVGTPSTEQMVQANTPLRFVGSPAQRTKAAQDKEQAAFVAGLPPDSPARQAYEAERVGLKTPPSTFAAPKDESEDVVYVSQDRKSFSRMTPDKGLVSTTGPFKKGTHFVEAPQPPQMIPVVVQTDSGPMLVNRGGGTAAPITGPGGETVGAPITGSTKTMMEGAQMLRPHVGRVDKLAQELDKRGLFGPVASRMREALTKVGTIDPSDFDKSSAKLQEFSSAFNAAVDADPKLSTDALVGQFATELGLLASGAGRVHGGARGGGSIQMIEYMKNMLGQNSTYQMFHGRMAGLDSYIGDYAKGPKGHGESSAEGTKTKRTRYDLNGNVLPD